MDFMEYEREYIDPCSTEPIVDMEAPAFFEEYKDMSSEELQEKFSEAQEHAVRLTGRVGFVDSHGEHVHLDAVAGGSAKVVSSTVHSENRLIHL